VDDLPAFATCPRHVRAADLGHLLVLIDYRTGSAQALPAPAARQWNAAARTGALDSASVPLGRQLLALGLLNPTSTPVPWPAAVRVCSASASWGSTEHPAGTVRPPRGPLAGTLAAGTALTATFAATRRRDGMRHALALLTTACTTTDQAATPAQAAAAVTAVRRAGWYSPGRTACLEESVAAVLLLAARRRRVRWCHGIASDPVRLHAWVQTVDGADVAEPSSTRAYTPVLTIGGPHHHPRRPG
jgi:hypothetical protein